MPAVLYRPIETHRHPPTGCPPQPGSAALTAVAIAGRSAGAASCATTACTACAPAPKRWHAGGSYSGGVISLVPQVRPALSTRRPVPPPGGFVLGARRRSCTQPCTPRTAHSLLRILCSQLPGLCRRRSQPATKEMTCRWIRHGCIIYLVDRRSQPSLRNQRGDVQVDQTAVAPSL